MKNSDFSNLQQNWKTALLVILLGLCASPAPAEIMVVPLTYANTSANTSDNAPLGASNQHLQQIYSASLLSGLSVGSQITAVGFRIASGEGSIVSQLVPDYSIWMGTAAVAPGSMSATFASNRSLDFTLVRSGSLDITTGDFPGGTGVNDFGYIQLNLPYTYTGGDLLIEIAYDNFPAGGANVNAAYPYNSTLSQTAFGSGASSTTADQGLYNEAIIMSFVVTPSMNPVPEPATLAVLAIGLAAIPLIRSRSAQRR
jgi:hypothetical protein